MGKIAGGQPTVSTTQSPWPDRAYSLRFKANLSPPGFVCALVAMSVQAEVCCVRAGWGLSQTSASCCGSCLVLVQVPEISELLRGR